MGREIEIKIPLTDVQYQDIFDFICGKKQFSGITAKDSVSEPVLVVKKDEYFSKYKTEVERRSSDEPRVIRLRTEFFGDKSEAYFTIKRKTIQNGIELNKEDETFVEKPEVIREMFEVAGYICWFCKEKRAYGVHCSSSVSPEIDFHLELVTVNGMKYAEIEVTQEEGDADKIKAALNDFSVQLGLDPLKKDSRSWVEIISSYY